MKKPLLSLSVQVSVQVSVLVLAQLLALATVAAGCRRKAPLPPSDAPAVATAAAPPAAEAPAVEQPTLVEVPPAPPPPPTTPLTGHAPTSDEIRAKLQPLFAEIGRCIGQARSVTSDERYLVLRFGISSSSGDRVNAELTGHEEARDCVGEALKPLHFEPWNGPPSMVALPLSRAGEPVPDSAFGDAGLK